MPTETSSPLRYRGFSTRYVDVAVRNKNEWIGLSVQYHPHPKTQQGCFIVRLVTHGEKAPKFSHLSLREKGEFVTVGPHAEQFKGFRLNKLAIPVFSVAVLPHEIDQYATKFGIWALLEEWLTEQIQTEGFTLTVNLLDEIKAMLVPSTTPEESVKSALELPVLTHTAPALALVKSSKDEPEEDDDEDEDDDETEEEWLN